MTSHLEPPSAARDARSLEKRVTELERRLGMKPTDRRRSPVSKAVGAHIQQAAPVAVPDAVSTTATGMVVEHDSGDGVASTDRLRVPTGYGGIWSIEVHAYSPDTDFPSPDFWALTMYVNHGATTTFFPTEQMSYQKSIMFHTHTYAKSGDYIRVYIDISNGGVTRDIQISCLSAYFVGSA